MEKRMLRTHNDLKVRREVTRRADNPEWVSSKSNTGAVTIAVRVSSRLHVNFDISNGLLNSILSSHWKCVTCKIISICLMTRKADAPEWVSSKSNTGAENIPLNSVSRFFMKIYFFAL